MYQSPPGVFEKTEVADTLPSPITFKFHENGLIKVLAVHCDENEKSMFETKSVF